MSYKYDKENGYRNADQLNADIDDYNSSLTKVIALIKKLPTSDVRNAINRIECMENEQDISEQQTLKSRNKIEVTRNENLVSDIKNDISEQQALENIKSTTRKEEEKEIGA